MPRPDDFHGWRIYCITVPCSAAISDLLLTAPLQPVVDAAHRLKPPMPQRAESERLLELRSTLEGSGQNRKVVLTMCAYARAIGRNFVEPCVSRGRIVPCMAADLPPLHGGWRMADGSRLADRTKPLSSWYDLRMLRKLCNIVNASRAAAVLAGIPFGVTRRNVRVGWFGRWLPGAPGTSIEDPAAALLSFEVVTRSEVWDNDRLGLWSVIRRHHPAGHQLWRFRGVACQTDPDCLTSYFPVLGSFATRALLTTFYSAHNLSDGMYDVYHWRSEQGPGIILASNRELASRQFRTCADALARAISKRKRSSVRPVVLVSDIPFGNVSLSPSYAKSTRFLKHARALLQPLVLKVDTTPGTWDGDTLWRVDMHLFVNAAEAFQCQNRNSSLCRMCSQSAESSSTTWLAGQRRRAGRETHDSWFDGLKRSRPSG